MKNLFPADFSYTGCHKYVPIEQRLNFRANRGYNLKAFYGSLR